MPKKFESQNYKALAAKARKTAVAEAKLAQKQKEFEDQQWIESDKHILKKQHRKELHENKRQGAISKKAETKLLLEKEMSALKANKTPYQKVTRTEIQNNLEKCQEATSDNKEIGQDVLCENINNHIREYEAKGIDEAIALLNLQEETADKHPERRLRAAYNSFEEKRMKELKDDNPNLRMSQLKQTLFKEWQKNVKSYLNKSTQ